MYGAHDLRLETVLEQPKPDEGEVLITVGAVGICGSDLHYYKDGGIGNDRVTEPYILGHEFMGQIQAVGENALDGNHQPLKVGQRIAIDPESPCYHCEMCEKGHPNLCPNHSFYGAYPTDGALQESMIVNARNCFPIPDSISNGAATLLETLGVAIHAIDLSHLKIGNSVAVIGCGPVGLLIMRLAQIAGASPIYAFDKLPWRVEKARQWGATDAWVIDSIDAVQKVDELTNGRGVDVAFEAAWADYTVQQAAEMACHGGKVLLVGIPSDDKLEMKHSVVRSKGLTILVSRRMKHTYPRAIQLAQKVDLDNLISHHFPLEETTEAFRISAAYQEGVHKIIIDVS